MTNFGARFLSFHTQTMHPDKFSMDEELMADEARRTAMEENYKRVSECKNVMQVRS